MRIQGAQALGPASRNSRGLVTLREGGGAFDGLGRPTASLGTGSISLAHCGSLMTPDTPGPTGGAHQYLWNGWTLPAAGGGGALTTHTGAPAVASSAAASWPRQALLARSVRGGLHR